MKHIQRRWGEIVASRDDEFLAREDGLTFQDRLGRCYELAGKYVMRHHDCTLVHGSIQGFGHPRIGHAWVIFPSGAWYDVISDTSLPEDVFKGYFNAQVDATYTFTEMASASVRSGHWGPWDGSVKLASGSVQYHDDTQHPRGDYPYWGTPFSLTISEPGVPPDLTKSGPKGKQVLGPFAQPGLVAYLDGFIQNQGGQIFIAYMRVRDTHRGGGLGRKLVQEVYDRWPDAEVDWGRVVDPRAGTLWEDFRARYPERGNHGKVWY